MTSTYHDPVMNTCTSYQLLVSTFISVLTLTYKPTDLWQTTDERRT